MLDNQYLLLGLNALSRAHKMNYFDDGHRGAAIISAFYLCRENEIEEGASEAITRKIDERWTHTELCAPFPDEDSDFDLINKIISTMKKNIGGLRQAGHNVIFPSLALKAFHDLPEAVIPSRVDGICRLIKCFHAQDVPMHESDDIPPMDDPAAAAEFILKEFPRCTESFSGRGQGWSGHLLTYGRALMDLGQLGYRDLLKKAEEGFRIYIRRIRLGPLQSDKSWKENRPTGLFPLQAAYWDERQGDWNLGHILKYPYGFYGLMNLAKNTDLKRRCLAEAYRIF
ncbi:MAG: hypothetical protein ACYTF1_07365 [Planctomycetota bacterium]|jgi:hypothetical protein